VTPDACRDLRGVLAAAALGAIEPAEEIALRAHLEGCPSCRAELRSLTSVAHALPRADPACARTDPAEPPGELADRIRTRVAGLRAHRRRTRLRVALAAAVLLVVATLAGVALVGPGSGSSGTSVAFSSPEHASGAATLSERDAGTEVELRASGLDEGEVYWLWLTDEGGDRVGAGTFVGTAEPVRVTMTAALALDDTRRVWVTDEDDAVVLDALLPR
jgi:hypothetical protein